MAYNPQLHHRRSIRLSGYDYTQAGAYFVTLCTQNRQRLFGHIKNNRVILSPLGQMTDQLWRELPHHFLRATLDLFIIMPDHLHGIIILQAGTGEAFADADALPLRTAADALPLRAAADALPLRAAADALPLHAAADASPRPRPNGTTPDSLGAIIQNYKSISTRKINQLRATAGRTVWQRNYYECILRQPANFDHVRQYILVNPLRWKTEPDVSHSNQSGLTETVPVDDEL